MLLHVSLSLLAMVHLAKARYLMYLTGQHDLVPDKSEVSGLTHVALAFMRSGVFNQPKPSSWPMFTTVENARSRFSPGTAIMVAIGGWGDTEGFEVAARTESGRKLFARNVGRMVEETGADGIDIDWEYPGGNGEDYKEIPNSAKAWQIQAYPLLLSTIRTYLGPHKLLSAAVPGLPRDMLAFTNATMPSISGSLDFLNIMTYDLMNRRDNITKHHTGVQLSLDSINSYHERGLPYEKMNLGFAFYVKWFKTAPHSGCDIHPIGCKTALLEDPDTGADLGRAGGFSYHDVVPGGSVGASYARATAYCSYDYEGGGNYYWDPEEDLWWSWDTPYAIAQKFPRIMEEKGLGGSFAWGLGEDAEKWKHFSALSREMRKYVGREASDTGKASKKNLGVEDGSHGKDEL